jgi:hypothetical protein
VQKPITIPGLHAFDHAVPCLVPHTQGRAKDRRRSRGEEKRRESSCLPSFLCAYPEETPPSRKGIKELIPGTRRARGLWRVTKTS